MSTAIETHDWLADFYESLGLEAPKYVGDDLPVINEEPDYCRAYFGPRPAHHNTADVAYELMGYASYHGAGLVTSRGWSRIVETREEGNYRVFRTQHYGEYRYHRFAWVEIR
ncbi:hypothetical protein ACFYYS_06110 [Streptomyces sp. NPDC002120]|uniref:hypothetical protein n=1 Tax=Streptomyces sp. NPDC002120 TaxID=3364631 RepID=UPI0036CB3E10